MTGVCLAVTDRRAKFATPNLDRFGIRYLLDGENFGCQRLGRFIMSNIHYFLQQNRPMIILVINQMNGAAETLTPRLMAALCT